MIRKLYVCKKNKLKPNKYEKRITYLNIAAICFLATVQQSFVQLTATAVAPVLSAEVSPIYFGNESDEVASLAHSMCNSYRYSHDV